MPAMERRESYEFLSSKDKELLNILKQTTRDKEYDMIDHTHCYIKRKKLGAAQNHICGGVKDIDTSKIAKKCLHCRFFFPVPTIKDVTKE